MPELWPVSVLSLECGATLDVRSVFHAVRQFDRHTWRVRLEQPNKERYRKKVYRQVRHAGLFVALAIFVGS